MLSDYNITEYNEDVLKYKQASKVYAIVISCDYES